MEVHTKCMCAYMVDMLHIWYDYIDNEKQQQTRRRPCNIPYNY